MDKRTEFSNALKTALKNNDKLALATIRLILAAMKDRDIALRSQGQAEGISEDEILSMLQSMIKQRKESEKTYCEAGREDLAERESAEIKIIEAFLPTQLNEEEINTIIETLLTETGAQDIKDMGKVMGALKSRYAGQIDMSRAGAAVKEILA